MTTQKISVNSELERVSSVPSKAGSRVRLERILPPFLAFVLFILIWQVVVWITGLRPAFLPAPLDVVNAFIENRESLLEAAWFTFRTSVTAFMVVLLLGTLIAFALSSNKFVERALYPYAVLLQATPVIAIVPIIIIWCGIGFLPIVIISVLVAIFAVIANTTQGLISVENNLQNLFRLYGANKLQTLLKLKLPFALPFMVTGWRIAAGLVVVGAVVGEFYAGAGGGNGGLGIIIVAAASRLKTPYLFSASLSAALLGVIFFTLVSYLGHLLLKNWHESAMQHEN